MFCTDNRNFQAAVTFRDIRATSATKNKSRARRSSRHDSQRAPGEETAEFDGLIARKRREQLSADQITAENKKKIYADPARNGPLARAT
jgi:hypothetical protein